MNQVSFSEIIRTIIKDRGIEILLQERRFVAMVDDLAPYLKVERKIMHRIQNLNIMQIIYDAYKTEPHNRQNILAKVEYLLKDEAGVSNEWCMVVLRGFTEAFGWEECSSDLQAKTFVDASKNPERVLKADYKEKESVICNGFYMLCEGKKLLASDCFEKVLSRNPECMDAYWGLALAEQKENLSNQYMRKVLLYYTQISDMEKRWIGYVSKHYQFEVLKKYILLTQFQNC